MSSNMKITRICEFCKNEFTAQTTKTRFCSLKCNSRAYKSRVKEAKIAESNKQTQAVRKPDLEVVKVKDFLSVNQASLLFGISRRTIYRLISRGELDIAKFGARTVIRRCDMDTFFSFPLEESILRPSQEFPGLENCYSITQIQQKFKISPGALYMLIQRYCIAKYAIGRFNYVARKDIDTIFNK
ncbi:helix-turn-helix domain-containing protein [Flavobacterium sp. W1B]|uniref:helix-turn-helix domain-containing protein n=1 Tax=Flavobacterium sp. W1B TaxID=3394146 RepID=UPI0039BD5960